MNRTRIVAVAILSGGIACGGDSKDSGETDSGPPVDMSARVNPAGAPCEQDSDCGGTAPQCATDLTLLDPPANAPGGAQPLDLNLPGGYCTATCTEHEQCGPGGGCAGLDVVAKAQTLTEFLPEELPDNLPDLDPEALGLAYPCAQRCERDASDCRDGYGCTTMYDALNLADLLEQAGLNFPIGVLLVGLPTYCLPLDQDTGSGDPADGGPGALQDAGTPDAGDGG